MMENADTGSTPKGLDSDELEAVVADLRSDVARRRAAGEYPPGLEAQLEAEFEAIMRAVHRPEVDTSGILLAVAAVADSARALGAPPATSSRVPGGSAVHDATARLVRRHTVQLAQEVRRLGDDVSAALAAVAVTLDQQRSADERQLKEVVASLLDRVAIIDHLADAVLELEGRVGALERSAGT
jgi:hypothetical protein